MYQYSAATLKSLRDLVSNGTIRPPTLLLRGPTDGVAVGLPSASLEPSGTLELKARLRKAVPADARAWIRRIVARSDLTLSARPPIREKIRGRLLDLGIDLVLIPAPDPLAFQSGVPSIMAIHDLQHRLQPEFPEVSQNGEWESREYIYRNAARESLLMLVDSEVGKEDVLELYGIYGATPDRVLVFPFVMSPALCVETDPDVSARLKERLQLPERFFLYPAQYWPHKNHARLIESLSQMEQSDAHLVLCGATRGKLRRDTYNQVRRIAIERGVEERVHHLGYVSDEDLSALYASALALVFPTFFGPTNIPVIEAWNFGIPVLSSRIRGITEQVGDAGLLVDPRSVEEMAGGLDRLWTDSDLRRSLIEAGRRRLALYTPEDHRDRLGQILAEASARLDA